MHSQWYPQDKNELNSLLITFLSKISKPKIELKEIHGLIAPHAGYEYSGEIAGKAFSLLKNKKINKAVILGPSHYSLFKGIKTLEKLETPLGKLKLIKNNLEKLEYEHSIENQAPFLQILNPEIEILPIVVGEITIREAEKIAKQLSKEKAIFVFSTDLSHFLTYEHAKEKDNLTIKAIISLNIKNLTENSACGLYPLLILIELCKLKNYKPQLIEYKNSGDITGDKSSVVGYASFYF